jgi:hypothetical protein
MGALYWTILGSSYWVVVLNDFVPRQGIDLRQPLRI